MPEDTRGEKMGKRYNDKWVMVVTGAALLAAVLYVVTTAEWSWSEVAVCTVFAACGVVLVTKGLRQ